MGKAKRAAIQEGLGWLSQPPPPEGPVSSPPGSHGAQQTSDGPISSPPVSPVQGEGHTGPGCGHDGPLLKPLELLVGMMAAEMGHRKCVFLGMTAKEVTEAQEYMQCAVVNFIL